MKKIIDKFNNSEYFMIKTIFFSFTVLLITIGTFGVTLSDTNSGYSKNSTVDGIVFKNIKVSNIYGDTKITSDVINSTGKKYNLETISVMVTYLDDSKEELIGYIGNKLEVDSIYVLEVFGSRDVNDIKDIEFIINK